MAAQQTGAAGSQPSAQVVSQLFVQQYYNVLHQSPQLVHRFYQESSRLGRPKENGAMESVTITEAINKNVLPKDSVLTEIRTLDAQDSLGGGFVVHVTGLLSGKEGMRREFSQSFFLAPQEKGYFVLNDIFRYVGPVELEHGRTFDSQESLGGGFLVLATGSLVGKEGTLVNFTQSLFFAPQEKGYYVLNDLSRHVGSMGLEDGHDNGSGELQQVDHVSSHNGADAAPLANGPREFPVPEHDEANGEDQNAVNHNAAPPKEEKVNGEEIYNPPEAEALVVKKEISEPVVVDKAMNNASVVVTSTSAPVPREEAPKKSYASIVKVMKENANPISVPSHPIRPPPPKVEKPVAPAPTPAPVVDVPDLTSNPETGNIHDIEAEGHSIYIKNLPLSATYAQLEEGFKRFGAIKPGGIQVRSHKLQGFCYGFIDFEEASAVQSAIEASPIMIGGRQAYVEEKRASGPRGGTRGRFLPGRGGNFRSDGMRGGRGSYAGGGGGGGRGYGRGDFGYRSEYGGRGGVRGGSSPRGGGDMNYQRVDHSGPAGGSRGPRPGPAPAAGPA